MNRRYRLRFDEATKALEKRDYLEAVEKAMKAMEHGDSRTEMLAAMAISLAAAIKDEETINNVLRLAKTEEPA